MRCLRAAAASPSNARLGWLLVFVECTGLRAAELLGARRAHLHRGPHGWVLRVHGKGRKNRTVPVPAAALQATRAYFASRGVDFEDAAPETPLLAALGSDSAPLGYSALHETFTRFVRRALKAADLPADERRRAGRASAHWLRHTHATRAAERNVPPDVLQENLGQSDPRTTARYYRAQMQRRQKEMERAFAGAADAAEPPSRVAGAAGARRARRPVRGQAQEGRLSGRGGAARRPSRAGRRRAARRRRARPRQGRTACVIERSLRVWNWNWLAPSSGAPKKSRIARVLEAQAAAAAGIGAQRVVGIEDGVARRGQRGTRGRQREAAGERLVADQHGEVDLAVGQGRAVVEAEARRDDAAALDRAARAAVAVGEGAQVGEVGRGVAGAGVVDEADRSARVDLVAVGAGLPAADHRESASARGGPTARRSRPPSRRCRRRRATARRSARRCSP